jgi:alpha-galactosidase
MGCHVGTSPAHSTGRNQAMAFRAGVAMPGHFGVELDLRKIPDGERAELRGAIAAYKAHRDLLHGSRVWQGEAGDGLLWQAHGDAEKMLLFLIRTEPGNQRHAPHIRLPMLEAARRYRLSCARAQDVVLDGAWLASVGFPAPPMSGEDVVLFEVTAQ